MFSSSTSEEASQNEGENNFLSYPGEFGEYEQPDLEPCKRHITVGDSLPYGVSLYYESTDYVMRMKDIGEHHRLLLLGVLGSFTPYCWNRHLYRVMYKLRYYEERGIDYICCISTNDVYVQSAWSTFIGCDNSIFMLSDSTTRFTKEIGMDTVIPWLDNTVRSKRYIIYAENMTVTKMTFSHLDGPTLKWDCEHLETPVETESESDTDSDLDLWFTDK